MATSFWFISVLFVQKVSCQTNAPTWSILPVLVPQPQPQQGLYCYMTKLQMDSSEGTFILNTGDHSVFAQAPIGSTVTITGTFAYDASKVDSCPTCIRQVMFGGKTGTRFPDQTGCLTMSTSGTQSFTLSFTYTSDGIFKHIISQTPYMYGCDKVEWPPSNPVYILGYINGSVPIPTNYTMTILFP
eukprot:756548_1